MTNTAESNQGHCLSNDDDLPARLRRHGSWRVPRGESRISTSAMGSNHQMLITLRCRIKSSNISLVSPSTKSWFEGTPNSPSSH